MPCGLSTRSLSVPICVNSGRFVCYLRDAISQSYSYRLYTAGANLANLCTAFGDPSPLGNNKLVYSK